MNKRAAFSTLSILLVLFYVAWWILLQLLAPTHDSVFNDYYADTYGIISGVGGLIGIIVAFRYGLLKSYVGRSISFFSLGLISQFLGQISYTILFYVYGIENAYPAFGEIFFLASIPLYILGLWYIGKSSGVTISLQSFKNRISVVLIPVLMIGISYSLFLRNYDGQDLPFNIVFLDYVYPLGQALFFSLAMLIFYLTNNILVGIIRNKILFILFSFLFQYIADSLFIFETRAETWYAGGLSDLMFVISYFLMTMALIRFENIEEDIKKRRVLNGSNQTV